MTVTYDREQPTREYIAACEDVDEVLDIRAEALEVVEAIRREMEADKLMPEPSMRWASRASYAKECWLRVARQATARLLTIAPETLDIPQPAGTSVAEMQHVIDRLQQELAIVRESRRAAEIADEGTNAQAQITSLKMRVAALTAEVQRKMQEDIAFKRERLAWQERRDRDFAQAFVDLAKQMLPDALYREVLRATMARVPETQMPPKQESAA